MFASRVLTTAFVMASSRSTIKLLEPDAKRTKTHADQSVLQSLSSVRGTTKQSTINVLLRLQQEGLLSAQSTQRQLTRQMHQASHLRAKTSTPYGPVVQKIALGAEKLQSWDICHPFAFLWHLTNISTHFSQIMASCATPSQPLRLVLYADELVPGNPFRPEKGRKLFCIYWAFVDWPGWLLSRSFAWPCFSILRSVVVDELEGGASYLARVIIRTFFPDQGYSFQTGLLIEGPGGPNPRQGDLRWLAGRSVGP